MQFKNVERIKLEDEKLRHGMLDLEDERNARLAKAYAFCDEVLAELSGQEEIRRFRRRHAGFLRAYLTTEHIHLAILYAHRLEHHGGTDGVIGHAIRKVLDAHYPNHAA